MAPGIGGPNLEWAPVPQRQQLSDAPPIAQAQAVGWPAPATRTRPFEGDIAIRELRRRLSLNPDVVPEPPIHRNHKSMMPWIWRLAFVFLLAAILAYGLALIPLSYNERPALQKQDRSAAVPSAPTPTLAAASSRLQSIPPARLIVERRQAFANEPLPLAVSLSGATGGESVLLSGLAAGTRLSSGGPLGLTGWRLPAGDLGRVMAYAPRDFVGAMDAAVDLRLPNDAIIDSQILRLEWVPKQTEPQPPRTAAPVAPVVRLDAEEMATLLRRGQEFFRTGDISSARHMLRRAAGGGSAQAALALGATFDPDVLAQLGVIGFEPDPAQARAWYQKAAELGSIEATRRLERLALTAQ